MKVFDGRLSDAQKAGCGVAAAALLIIWFVPKSQMWIMFITLGIVLVAISFEGRFGEQRVKNKKDEGELLPAKWDEQEIAAAVGRMGEDRNAVLHYFEQVKRRFVDGQSTKTAEIRLAFLAKQNELVKLATDNYRLRREAVRAGVQEDVRDVEANTVDLAKLRIESERERLLAEIEEARYKRENIGKAPLPSPKPPSASDSRERRKAELNDREKQVRDAIAVTRADPTLTEEQKQRKLNALEDRLAEIHEEQAKLL